MAPRLKVFTWSDGFHAFTVAASSRPKALAAWGSQQDLFATGLASELTGGPDFDAALASPGEVIKRGQAIDIGTVGKASKPRPASAASKARREEIARIEAALDSLEAERRSALDAIDTQVEQLERERAEVDQDHERRRKDLLADLKKARR